MWSNSIALALSIAAALYLDRRSAGLGLLPPAFAISPWRRAAASALLAGMFFLSAFAPILSMGESEPLDLSTVPAASLFVGHAMLLAATLAWVLLGFAGTGTSPLSTETVRQLGLASDRMAENLALGLLGGVVAWFSMIVVALVVFGMLGLLGVGDDWLPQGAPPAIAQMAGLPFVVRLALVLSAGFFEEVFFRGLLQPRVGIVVSTMLFVFAHAGYGQPSMLVSLTVVSLVMAGLVAWRQTLWPAVFAHAAFDAIQLLVLIPSVLPFVPVEGASGP